jgi:hypothetical protein
VAAGTASGRAILTVGSLRSLPSGLRHYGDALDDALRQRGWAVRAIWGDDAIGSGTVLEGMRSGARLLRRVWRMVRPGELVVVQYVPAAFGARGLAGPGALIPLAVRRVNRGVCTVLHELALPWGRNGLAGLLQAVSHRLALLAVVAGSDTLVVTTPDRGEWLRARRWLPHRPVVVIPVWSSIPVEHRREGSTVGDAWRVGCFSWSRDTARDRQLAHRVLGAVAAAATTTGTPVELRLLGAPGPRAPAATRLSDAAKQFAPAAKLSFSDVLTEAELSRELACLDAYLHLDPAGPTTRRGSRAAALAHEGAVVAIDGPQTDPLFRDGAVHLTDERELGAGLGRVLGDADLRAQLRRRARATYHAELSLERAAAEFDRVLEDLTRRPERAARRR